MESTVSGEKKQAERPGEVVEKSKVEQEADLIITLLDKAARSVVEDGKINGITDAMLDRGWSMIWEPKVATAADFFKKSLENRRIRLSYDSGAMESVRQQASPLTRAVFDKFRGVTTHRELELAKRQAGK